MDNEQHWVLFACVKVTGSKEHRISAIFECNHVIAQSANLVAVPLSELVPVRSNVQLFEHLHFQIAAVKQLVEGLTVCRDLLEADAVDLRRQCCLTVVEDESVLEQAHHCVVTHAQSILIRDTRHSEHFDLASSRVDDVNSMLTLNLRREDEEFVRFVQELGFRVSVVIAIQACKFLVISRVCRNAINHSLGGNWAIRIISDGPAQLLELIASSVANEFLIACNVSKLSEVARKAWLHGHILASGVHLAKVVS